MIRYKHSGNFIGIDIGGTKTKIGYLNSEGHVEELILFPTRQDTDCQIRQITESLRSTVDMSQCIGIGIAAPGPLNQKKGIIFSPPNLKKWSNFKIADILKKEFSNVQIKLENDANCGALGEALFGAGKNAETVLYITISTGLGAGIVINGKIHRGYKGLAAEIWSFDPACFNGFKGKYNLNDLTTGNGLVKQARDRIKSGESTIIPSYEITTQKIMSAWAKKDPMAINIIENARNNLTGTIAFLITAIAPDIIVIGGGLTSNPEWFFLPLKNRINKILAIDEFIDIPIKLSEFGSNGVLYGAIGLFYDSFNNHNGIKIEK